MKNICNMVIMIGPLSLCRVSCVVWPIHFGAKLVISVNINIISSTSCCCCCCCC